MNHLLELLLQERNVAMCIFRPFPRLVDLAFHDRVRVFVCLQLDLWAEALLMTLGLEGGSSEN